MDTFTRAYAECAIWTTLDDSLGDCFTADDIAPDALAAMTADCVAFAEANADALARYYAGLGYGPEQAGHDFWLTRNGHGAGFRDRYSGADQAIRDACTALTDAANAYGESYLYIDDDGKLYVA